MPLQINLQIRKEHLMKNFLLLTASLFFMLAVTGHAATIAVPYGGAYNEAVIPAEGGFPAGDYDTIGGGPDTGLFNLINGTNTFTGSIFAPDDTSDAFNIGIGPDQKLTGASIVFGTNLSPFNPMFSFDSPGTPFWNLEESSGTDPTIFLLPVGSDGLTASQTLTAPAFLREEGIYNVLIGNGVFGSYTDSRIDYTMTFTVETSAVPEPGTWTLFSIGLLGFAGAGRRKK